MWPNRATPVCWWIKMFSLLATLGLLLMLAGFVTNTKNFATVGLVLSAPLLAGGVLATVVGLPYMLA
jgi:hypothetical protein